MPPRMRLFTVAPFKSASKLSRVRMNLPQPVDRQINRQFTSSRTRRQHEHRTYFQRESQGVQQPYGNPGGDGFIIQRQWGFFSLGVLLGFLTFPAFVVLYDFNKPDKVVLRKLFSERALEDRRRAKAGQPPLQSQHYQGLARTDDETPGQEANPMADPADVIMQLENALLQVQLAHVMDSTEKDEEIRSTQSLLNNANESQLKIHKALFDTLTSGADKHVVLDDALLESRPIVLSDETRLPTSKAALMRVLDKHGKNRILILGVDLDHHKDMQSRSARWPADCYNLDSWLCEIADDLSQSGGNAEDGLAIFLYANRVVVDVNYESSFRWMTRYQQSDFPKGFPLEQMRKIERVHDASSSLKNSLMKETVKATKSGQEKETP